MVVQGYVYEFSCAADLIYCQSAGGCTYPDTCSGDSGTNGWWERWGKSAAAILGGAGIEGLGGAGIGSVVPGPGTSYWSYNRRPSVEHLQEQWRDVKS